MSKPKKLGGQCEGGFVKNNWGKREKSPPKKNFNRKRNLCRNIVPRTGDAKGIKR